MKIEVIDLKKRFEDEKLELLSRIKKVLKKGNLVLTEELKSFENSICKFTGSKFCLGLNSGTDALMMSLWALGIKKGDEVITSPISFIASISSIIHVGAKPVLVDVNDDLNLNTDLIEKAITKKTKAIMPVHLTGRMCSMDKIKLISKKYSIPVIEDCAQSILSKYKTKMSGSWGDVGCFSAHPLKNLNAMGDGGYLTTNNKKIYEKIKSLRTHGMNESRNNVKNFGFVSRMDNLQAAILNFRINNLKRIIKIRRNNVKLYLENLNMNKVYFPYEKKDEFNTYHTFVIQVDKRDQLRKYLREKGIDTAIHYPIPIHLQKASRYLKYSKGDFPVTEMQSKRILTLPINQFLKKKEIIYISNMVNNFFS